MKRKELEENIAGWGGFALVTAALYLWWGLAASLFAAGIFFVLSAVGMYLERTGR